MLREAWSDEEADTPLVPPASRELARRVAKARRARWAGVKGLEFRAGGELSTPWSKGTWGVLADKPGVLFADFGGARHELDFARWPEFVSTRCSDGEHVKGGMLLDYSR